MSFQCLLLSFVASWLLRLILHRRHKFQFQCFIHTLENSGDCSENLSRGKFGGRWSETTSSLRPSVLSVRQTDTRVWQRLSMHSPGTQEMKPSWHLPNVHWKFSMTKRIDPHCPSIWHRFKMSSPKKTGWSNVGAHMKRVLKDQRHRIPDMPDGTKKPLLTTPSQLRMFRNCSETPGETKEAIIGTPIDLCHSLFAAAAILHFFSKQ